MPQLNPDTDAPAYQAVVGSIASTMDHDGEHAADGMARGCLGASVSVLTQFHGPAVVARILRALADQVELKLQ